MTKDQIMQRVKYIIVEQLQVSVSDVLPASTIIDDLGADSLDIVELAMAVEEEFNIEIYDKDVENSSQSTTIQNICDYIEGRLKK